MSDQYVEVEVRERAANIAGRGMLTALVISVPMIIISIVLFASGDTVAASTWGIIAFAVISVAC